MLFQEISTGLIWYWMWIYDLKYFEVGFFIFMALFTKMSQLGHYETIRTDGNVHWERSSQVNPCEIAIIDKV